jgi:putative membrane protein
MSVSGNRPDKPRNSRAATGYERDLLSDINDPRVLFAAERTLLAWNRTASGLIALGFVVDRAAIFTQSAQGGRGLAAAIGVAFILLGVLLNVLSVLQYRRAVASLRPVEIPPHYWPNLAAVTSIAVAALGLLLALYVLSTL